jgi:hypothetical protein
MKSLRLLAITLLASTCAASAALACDSTKSAAAATSCTSATAASATKANGKVSADGCCSAEATAGNTKTSAQSAAAGCPAMPGCPVGSAQCTAAMRAACEKNSATAAAMGCNMKGATSATTASNTKDGCAAHATTAANNKDACAAHATTAAAGKCDMKGASAAKGAPCPMHGSATTAGMERCANAKGAASTASAAGMICAGHMNGVAHDCSACEVWADCDQAVQKLGAKSQVVSLKNGAMIVYTADSNSDIKALQSLVSKRNDKMLEALSAGTDKKLCDECKQLRGAMASGTLHREVVNVERGCMTLITSNDQGVVQKIRTMTGQSVALR